MSTENTVEPKVPSSAAMAESLGEEPSADTIGEKANDVVLEISQLEIVPSESDSSKSNPFAILALIAVIVGIGIAFFYSTRSDTPAPVIEPPQTQEIAEPEAVPPKSSPVPPSPTIKEAKKVEPKKAEPKKPEEQQPFPREEQLPVPSVEQQPVPGLEQQPIPRETTRTELDNFRAVENEAMRDQVVAEEYHQRGDYANALARYQKAQNGFESLLSQKVVESEYVNTASIQISLASIYNAKGDICRSQKKLSEALDWLNKSLEIRKKVQGENHPEVAKIYNNIALVYAAQGQHAKALEWYQKDLAISEKTLGADHPDTAMTYSNIGISHFHLGNRDNALRWFKKALVIQEKHELDKNPNAAMTYNNIGELYRVQGNYALALPEYLNAYRILQNTFGEEHATTKAVMLNLSRAYEKSDNTRPFAEWLEESLR